MKVDYKFRHIVVEDGDTGDELIKLIKEHNLGKFAIIFKKEVKAKLDYPPGVRDILEKTDESVGHLSSSSPQITYRAPNGNTARFRTAESL